MEMSERLQALATEKAALLASDAERVAKQIANKGADSLRRLRDRLQQEIKTSENNILFFTAKSKTANQLVDSMQRKINELKKQLDEIQTKMDNED